MAQSYIREASAAIIVYDVINRESFYSVDGWMAEVKRKAPANTFTVLVGNKVDSLEERCTTSDEAAYKAKEWGAMYAEVSAKTGENINNFFTKIARKLIEREFLTPQAEEVSDNVD